MDKLLQLACGVLVFGLAGAITSAVAEEVDSSKLGEEANKSDELASEDPTTKNKIDAFSELAGDLNMLKEEINLGPGF